MSSGPFSEAELSKALQACADEPVHICGTIQPIGYLLGCDYETGLIRYASENCEDLFGLTLDELFSKTARDVFGPENWHQIQNFKSQSNFARKRHFVGFVDLGDETRVLHLSKGGDALILEIEDESEQPKSTPESVREQAFLIDQIQACEDEATLFDLTTRLMRHVTGFDRVMIYKFDADWNGQVLAEARKPSQEPYIGLRFPHWDIPAQARDIMAQIKLRMITNVDQVSIPVRAADPKLEPLDLTLAQLRGVSEIHMQYLRNMKSAATMTLSVVLDDHLWGIISFHSQRPRVASPDTRHMLVNSVLPIFCLKLNLLRGRDNLALSRRLDHVQANIQDQLEERNDINEVLEKVGEAVCDVLSLTGLAVVSGSQSHTYGQTVPSFLIEALMDRLQGTDTDTLAIDSLSEMFPEHAQYLGSIGGALVVGHPKNRGLILFRDSLDQSIAWAGNPEKTIETVDGSQRLRPRGSFSTYLESVKGKCLAWSDNDLHLASQLWPLLSAAERQAFMNDLSRQQILMIGELNHRVRNILSLVKSVSQQARRTGGSLETYSEALEARIYALAAAHDIGSGAARSSVSLHRIVQLETSPFDDQTQSRLSLSGPDFFIRAENAPIFTLVIHELMTNAVKYGALSVPDGRLQIEIKSLDHAVELLWTETGGPEVTEPETKGFGSTLITQAVPFEMNGKSELIFDPKGVRAKISLPRRLIDAGAVAVTEQADEKTENSSLLPTQLRNGLILIIEDNFMIASDLQSDLNQLGFPNTEILSNAEDALEYVAVELPAIAILDINLGHGQTSEPIATELVRLQVPFIFVSGYGDQVNLPPHLSQAPVFTKPISKVELSRGLSMLAGQSSMNED